jgi:MoxR-like ATPase
MRISLGYPDRAAERLLLAGEDRRDMVDTLPALLTPHELAALQRQVLAVHTSDALLNYVQDLVAATRSGKLVFAGPVAARRHCAGACGQGAGADQRARLRGTRRRAGHLPQTIAHRLVPVGDAGRGAVEQVRAMVDAVPLA